MPIFHITCHETNLFQRQSWNHSVPRTVLMEGTDRICPKI